MPLREERRERVLAMIRQERSRQIGLYGHNDDIALGFGGSVSDHPWLSPIVSWGSDSIERLFRRDYVRYEGNHGRPTWMHLIREEVAELFAATDRSEMTVEAVQVAALCVSLVEHLIAEEEVANEASDQ